MKSIAIGCSAPRTRSISIISAALHASVYPQLAFKRSEVDWEPAWFGLNITMRVPGVSKPKLDQFIFPSSNRFTQARIGVPPSHNLRIRVPTDDTKTTTFWVKIYPLDHRSGPLEDRGAEAAPARRLRPRRRWLVGHPFA